MNKKHIERLANELRMRGINVNLRDGGFVDGSETEKALQHGNALNVVTPRPGAEYDQNLFAEMLAIADQLADALILWDFKDAAITLQWHEYDANEFYPNGTILIAIAGLPKSELDMIGDGRWGVVSRGDFNGRRYFIKTPA